MSKIEVQPGIMQIALYQGGQSKIEGVADVVKLSSNENPFGLSDKAKEASSAGPSVVDILDHLSLRTAIAEVHGLNVDKIIPGVGSDEIITFSVRPMQARR